MTKKILAIAAIAAFLLVSMMPMAVADADDIYTEEKTIRSSAVILKHSTCVAIRSATISYQTMYVYEEGADGSMKAYIADPQKNTPGKSLTQITGGKSYEVYYYGSEYVVTDYFTMGPKETALGTYYYDIFVEEAETGKLLINSVVNDRGIEKFNYYVRSFSETGLNDRYCYVGVVTNLDPNEYGYQVTGNRYDDSSLYYEMEMKLTIVHYTGSPTLYVGLCIVVVALVGATLFMCGRRPKL